MTLTPEALREFDDLLDRYVEADLNAAGLSKLNDSLAANVSLQHRFLDYLALHSALEWEIGEAPEISVPGVAGSRGGSGPVEVAMNLQLADESMAVKAVAKTAATRPFRPVVWSVLAAGLLFAAYFVAISWNMLGREVERVSGLATSGIDAVAMIAASEDAKWAEDHESFESQSGASAKSEVVQGELLRLASGLVEIHLKQGTTLLVEGPAEWKIDGENAATLERGQLIARVPREAVGFLLETPTAKIVDLGTEFSTVVSKTGETSLHVLRGEVELAHNGGPSKSQRVLAGEAWKVGKTVNGTVAVEKIPFDAAQVAIEKRPRSPLERWRAASQKLRKDPDLVAYYDFECDGNVLKNVLGDRLHGEIATPRESVPRTNGRWRGKGALALGKDFATVAIPDHPDFVPGDAWSIALWLRPDALPSGRVYALVVGKCDFPKRSFGLWFHGRGTLEFGLGSTNGKQYSCAASAAVALNRWHFVVGVIESGELRFYLEGKQVGATRFPGQAATNSMPVTLGNSRERSNPHSFTGAVDELAIYRRALSATEVQEMYQAGKPAQ